MTSDRAHKQNSLFGNFRRKTAAGTLPPGGDGLSSPGSQPQIRISHHSTTIRNLVRRRAGFSQDPGFENVIRDIVERAVADVVKVLRTGELDTAAVPQSPGVDALAAARARGAVAMKAHLLRPDNLSLDAAAAYAGRSARHINQLRQRGELYALAQDGSARGFRYPQWQFDAESARRRQIVKMLTDRHIDCWTLHEFMTRPNDALGMAPKDAVIDPAVPLDAIGCALERRFDGGEQGAS